MKRNHPISRRRRSGSAIIEMSLVMMILLEVCFGSIEFGYYFYSKNTADNAAREGACAAVAPGATQAQVTTAIDNALTAAGFSTSQWTITTSPNPISNCTIGNNVTITVSGTWSTVGTNFRPLQIMSPSKTVSGSATMRKEG